VAGLVSMVESGDVLKPWRQSGNCSVSELLYNCDRFGCLASRSWGGWNGKPVTLHKQTFRRSPRCC